tara:strand:- start:925 stop:1152 length:228 start_codon:yes stop_codon:yes gene_type:complete
MEQKEEVYETTCIVTREDINKDVEAQILRFKPKDFIVVVIQGQVKLNLNYEPAYDGYIGEKMKMPFITKGPIRLK